MLLATLVCLTTFADDPAKPAPKTAAPPAETKLFNGKDTTGWKAVDTGGANGLSAADGCLKLAAGTPMSGCVVADGKGLPATDYEIEFEARRDDGTDLFACLTFQVGKETASLVLGGWGGSTCGLSSINGSDASENETSKQREFKNGQWYKVKLRVQGRKVTAWVDGEELFAHDATDTSLSTRIEVAACAPLGFATYRTAASLRNLVLRKLPAAP